METPPLREIQRERERETKREGDKDRDRETENFAHMKGER